MAENQGGSSRGNNPLKSPSDEDRQGGEKSIELQEQDEQGRFDGAPEEGKGTDKGPSGRGASGSSTGNRASEGGSPASSAGSPDSSSSRGR